MRQALDKFSVSIVNRNGTERAATGAEPGNDREETEPAMSYPGAYTPGPSGPVNQNAIIAAMPGDPLAEAISAGLRQLGWQTVVTNQIAAYAREARICVVPLTPTSVNSSVVSAAITTPGATLVPLVVGQAPLPNAPWATAPIVFMGDPQRAASEIAAAANNIGAPGSPSGYGAPAPSSQYGYPASPSVPMTPGYPGSGPTAQMPGQPYQPASDYQNPASQSQTLYQQGYGQPGQPSSALYGQPYAAAPAAPTKRRVPVWVWIVGGVVALVLIACIGFGAYAYSLAPKITAAETQTALANEATATPVATATPSVPAGFTQYTDDTNGFSVAYPQSWTKSTESSGGDSGVQFLDTSDAADWLVLVSSQTLSPSEVITTENTLLQASSSDQTDTNLQGPTTVTYGGASWTQETADATDSGTTLTASVLATSHGGKEYIVFELASKDSFATIDQQYFQPMLNSFTFAS